MSDLFGWEPHAPSSGGGGVTSVTGVPPIASSGGTTPAISLTGVVPVANGGTGAATGAQNLVFATPNGSSGAPSFRALVAADLPPIGGAVEVYEGIIAGGVFGAGTVMIPPGMAVGVEPLSGSTDYSTFIAGEDMTLVRLEVFTVLTAGGASGAIEVRRYSAGWATIASVSITSAGTVIDSGALSVAIAKGDNIGLRGAGIAAYSYLWGRMKFTLP